MSFFLLAVRETTQTAKLYLKEKQKRCPEHYVPIPFCLLFQAAGFKQITHKAIVQTFT